MPKQMRFSARAAGLLFAVVCFPATAQVTFKEFVDYCIITGASADGSVVVGTYDNGVGLSSACRWTASGGVEVIAEPGSIFRRVAISRDGKTIVGTVSDSRGNFHAAIWQGGKNWRILNPFPGAVPSKEHAVSVANGVSGDGSVVVGHASLGEFKIAAMRWDAVNGMVNLGTFDVDAQSDSDAYTVSADGRTIIGWDYKAGFIPAGRGGSSLGGRRGAIWWDGRERLLHPFGWAGEAWATNDVGSIIVGQFHPLDANNSPLIGHGASTYKWTAWDGHFEDLGAAPIPIGIDQTNYLSQPYAVSDDGSVLGGESGRFDKFAMIWTYQSGTVFLSDFLNQVGVTEHKKWVSLSQINYISPDGHKVVGYGFPTQTTIKSFIVTIP